jgi:orotidine-5'-phosphate decarboxylase
MAPHPHANRLAYALDVTFDNCPDFSAAFELATRTLDDTLQALQGTGVIIKGNSVFRLLGGMALIIVASEGCKIFADYKLFDVQSTIKNDASWLKHIPSLEILTVAEDVHPKVFKQLAEYLPDTIIAPINPLTDLGDTEFKRRGEKSRSHATKTFFERVSELGARGIICSAKDIPQMPNVLRNSQTIICPAIRPSWASVPGDTNSANSLTHQEAIKAGAQVLVVGSPLRFEGKLRENTLRLLDEVGDLLEGERG